MSFAEWSMGMYDGDGLHANLQAVFGFRQHTTNWKSNASKAVLTALVLVSQLNGPSF